MRRTLGWLTLGLACAAAAAPAGHSLRTVATTPAWDALALGGRVITIEPDFRAAVGRDPLTGKQVWRTEIQKEARGRQTLRPIGNQLGWWAGDQLYLLDPATGKQLGAPASVPWNNDCWLDEEHGACYIRCPCSLQMLDCATGHPVGASFVKSSIEEVDPDGKMSSGCYGEGGEVLGRAGNLDLVRVEDAKAKSDGFAPPVAVALDVTTGKPAWRSPQLALGYWVPGASGISPDHKTCFVSDFEGQLVVFDCATGTWLWGRPALAVKTGLPTHMASWVATPPGIFRLAGDSATLLEPRTGKPRWSVRAPNAIVQGMTLESGRFGWSDQARAIHVLAPADGHTVATLELPPQHTLSTDPAGGFYRVGPAEIVAFDAAGKLRARVQLVAPQNAVVGPDWLTLFSKDRIVVLDRALGLRVDRPGELAIESSGPLAGGVLLYQWGPSGQPGSALLLAP